MSISIVVAALLSVVFATLELAHLLANASYDAETMPTCRVETSEKVVALTFDDGPDSTLTEGVLHDLQAQGARATFFLIGMRAQREPALVTMEQEAGMEIGNHTWSHPRLIDLPDGAAIFQIERTRAYLTNLVTPSEYFRPPFGEITAEQLRALASRYVTVHWSIAIDHYVGGLAMSPTEAAESLAQDIGAGEIILAHDALTGSPETDQQRRTAHETLVLLLPMLRARGFRIIPVGELLADGVAVPATPRTWFWQSGFECRRD